MCANLRQVIPGHSLIQGIYPATNPRTQSSASRSKDEGGPFRTQLEGHLGLWFPCHTIGGPLTEF